MKTLIDLGNQINSLADAENYASSLGIKLTPTDREAIEKAQEAELQRLSSLNRFQTEYAATNSFSERYILLLELINGAGNILLTLSQTLIVSLGIPIVLVLLLIVEQQRVVHGIELFEPDSALASFAATSLVLLNLVIEFQIHFIEQQAKYEERRDKRFSLRLWVQNVAYTVGLGKQWQPRELSPASRYRQLLRIVTFSILSLALAGSMRTIILSTNGTWFQALRYILTESNLSLITTWIGGLLFAIAAVTAAQSLSRYVAIRCVEILKEMSADQNQESTKITIALDSVGANYVLAKISTVQAKQMNRSDVEKEVSQDIPFLEKKHQNTTD